MQGSKGDPGIPGLRGEPGEASASFGTSVFSAFKTGSSSGGFTFNGVITFDTIVLGEDLINKGTGIFTVKTAGTYFFFFSGIAYGSTWLGIHVNGNRELILNDNEAESSRKSVSFIWSLVLQSGDQIQLKIEHGNFFVDANNTPERIYFNGFLVKPSDQ